jgi:hypothetical protein
MTSARQERKMRNRWRGMVGALSIMLVAACVATGPIGAATTERVVTDRYSGLAISGYDPVAYFTEAGPKLGRGELEMRHAGATWRFRNEGNRAAFAADPDVFMPRFGGHDPISVARGGSAPGHPEVWAISEDRLYLFYTEAARDTFLRDPARAIEAAERHWPEVLRMLSP